MKKIIINILALALVLGTAQAQVSKQVEVTKTYIPKVETAKKLMLMPEMNEPKQIDPDIDYSITPISIESALELEPYKAARMDFSNPRSYDPFYLKLGFGLPGQSDIDFYGTKVYSERSFIMGYLNHQGQYGKIKNDFGVKEAATESNLGVGLVGSRAFGERTLLAAFEYRNDFWSRYASSGSADAHPLFNNFGLNASFGDDFLDLSSWNYLFEGGLSAQFSRESYKNITGEIGANFGRNLFGGEMIFSFEDRFTSGSDSYKNNTLKLGGLFSMQKIPWKFSIGFDFYNDYINYYSQAKVGEESDVTNYIVPRFNLEMRLDENKLIAFVDVDGELYNNDFASLSEENPFIANGSFGERNTVDYLFNLGLKGRIANEKLGYKVYAKYRVTRNKMYWALDYTQQSVDGEYSNAFIGSYSNQDNLGLNVELEYQPRTNLLFQTAFITSHNFNRAEQSFEDWTPTTTFELGAKYSLGNFGLHAVLDVLGKRDYTQITNSLVLDAAQMPTLTTALSTQKLDTSADLSFKVDYKLGEDFKLFAELNNLFSSDIYPIPAYLEYGTNFMVGIQLQF